MWLLIIFAFFLREENSLFSQEKPVEALERKLEIRQKSKRETARKENVERIPQELPPSGEPESRSFEDESGDVLSWRRSRVLKRGQYYLKASSTVNYFNLGPEFLAVIKQIEDTFGGKRLKLSLLNFNPEFSLSMAKPVRRAPTFFLPTGGLAIGYFLTSDKKHQLEFDFGLAGLVPLKTIDLKTEMTLTEYCDNSNINNCPMAKLGFVNPQTLRGHYSFQMSMNEDVWILSPSVYYEYEYLQRNWGRLTAGLAVGAMILGTSQKIAFYSERTDLLPPESPADYFQKRVLQGRAESNNTADVGPLFRLYTGYRPPKFKNLQTEFRLGINYGFVYLHRDVDGTGMALLGDTLAASFPLTALGFKSIEVNKFEMLGAFVQAGVVF
ncbi:MAG: hypothetical protein RML34_05660 [Leptospiraceae bacterium]|nr:hypothetical protein [Leptospiraceae bacterium]